MPISVSIVEDSAGTRDGLIALVQKEPRLRYLSSYGTGEAARRTAEHYWGLQDSGQVSSFRAQRGRGGSF